MEKERQLNEINQQHTATLSELTRIQEQEATSQKLLSEALAASTKLEKEKLQIACELETCR